MRRRMLLAVAAVAVAGGGIAAVGAAIDGPSAPAAGSDEGAATGTAVVARRTLVDQDEVDGTLGYGDARPVANRGQGTVTRLAAVGSVVERNGVLYELDGRGVRLLYGDVPFYRRLADGVEDGPDVLQVEANLKELGFFKGKPNDVWDSASTAAVERWQKSIGADEDGAVDPGEVVFEPAAVRVSSHKESVGSVAQPGASVLEVTGTARLVRVDLDARKQQLAQQGAKVEVSLPDGKDAAGTITSVGTVATSAGGDGDSAGGGGGGDEDPTIPVVIALDDARAGGTLDGAPVKVRLGRSTREGVLAVPVNALLALAEGGYAVEAVEGAGSRLLRVETGLFADGYVEVEGDGLREGMTVVVPK